MDKYPKLNNFNEMYTPTNAVDIIVKYLPKDKIYREACYGLGHFAKRLEHHGYNVVGNKDMDCLVEQPETRDVFITNPPFNGNKKFVERAINLGKPFVILFRLEHLGGVQASNLLKNLNDITIIIPEKRINYITPKMMRGEKVGGSPFHSIFLCHGIGLEKQIIYD